VPFKGVGPDNCFLFGLTAQEVAQVRASGYSPATYLSGELKELIDLIRGGFFSRGDSEIFRPLIDGLVWHDPYLLFADFASYVTCQQDVSENIRGRR